MNHSPFSFAFLQGAITPTHIAEIVQQNAAMLTLGAHSLFLGQVRADEKENGSITAIEYTCYAEMATAQIQKIITLHSTQYALKSVFIYHSIGTVAIGEICLCVAVGAAHRKEAIEACQSIVESIKKEVPIWGREIINESTSIWKTNHFSSSQ
ncbi:MAG: molybdenum cofactor biosynthesis protein MoaE [Cytophagales bacterium]|nr:MAG: molybdenum cofactor biosynthesis protein MoaE [Cytophagales bacterium]